MPRIRVVAKVHCSTCTAWLDYVAIDPDEHAWMIENELCRAGCRRLHCHPGHCRVCAQVRKDQVEEARRQDEAGFGPQSLPKPTKWLPEYLAGISNFIWKKV
jgi:hypothetical protein